MTNSYDVAVTGIIWAGLVAIALLALIGFSFYEGRERELIETRLDLMEERLKTSKEDDDTTHEE